MYAAFSGHLPVVKLLLGMIILGMFCQLTVFFFYFTTSRLKIPVPDHLDIDIDYSLSNV